jgi:hypothetical protein
MDMRKSTFTEEQIIKGLKEQRKISGTVRQLSALTTDISRSLSSRPRGTVGRRPKRAIIYRLDLALFVQQRDGR